MNLTKTRAYKCPSCSEIFVLEVEKDERALYPHILCEKCDTLAPLYRDPEQIAGNIEDIENNNLQI